MNDIQHGTLAVLRGSGAVVHGRSFELQLPPDVPLLWSVLPDFFTDLIKRLDRSKSPKLLDS